MRRMRGFQKCSLGEMYGMFCGKESKIGRIRWQIRVRSRISRLILFIRLGCYLGWREGRERKLRMNGWRRNYADGSKVCKWQSRVQPRWSRCRKAKQCRKMQSKSLSHSSVFCIKIKLVEETLKMWEFVQQKAKTQFREHRVIRSPDWGSSSIIRRAYRMTSRRIAF